MAGSRKVVAGVPNILSDNPDILMRDLQDGEVVADEVAELLGGLGDGGEHVVSVSVMNGRKFEWLFDCDSAEVDASQLRALLRDEYGGGEFKITVRKNGVFVGHKNLSIRQQRQSKMFGRQNDVVAPPVDRLGEILATMQQQMAASQMSFQEAMMRQSQEGQKQQVELMRLMIESKGGGGQTDVIGLLSLAKELFTKKDDSVALLLKGIELHKELSPEKTEGGGLSEVVKTLGAPLAAMMAEAKKQKGGNGDGDGDDFVTSEEEEMRKVSVMQEMQIKMAAGMFVKAAAAGSDVKKYAEIFCEQYGDAVPEDFLLDVDVFNKIYDVVPEAVPHKVWFENLRVACVEILFEEHENAAE